MNESFASHSPSDHKDPSFLYRYRPLTKDAKRAEKQVIQDELSLIENGFIWLSDWKGLNDPFDCRPICDPKQIARLEQLLENFLVGCMSATSPDKSGAIPMWSHYANNHKGICIEFPFDEENASSRIPIERVSYTNARFDIRSLDSVKMRITSPKRFGMVVSDAEINDPENNIDIRRLTHKSKAWSHEIEWRYIFCKNHTRPKELIELDEKEHGPKAEHKALIAKPTKVILGAKMAPGMRSDLKRRLATIGVRTVDAVLSETEYKLELRE